jgi:lipoprotein LprG
MVLRRVRVLVALVFTAVVACVLAGCTGGSNTASTANLPAASGLLSTASSSMHQVSSVHFTITVNGNLAGIPVTNAEGDLNAQGQAKGNARLTEFGQLVQVDFVLVNSTFYIKGPTGGYQKIPAMLAGGMFDPSAILNPDKGIAKLLGSVQNPATEAQESVNGTDCYRISGKVGQDVVSALVPGVGADVSAKVWLATDTRHLPVKAEFAVPGKNGTSGATVDVSLSKVNEPVSVSAP